MTTYVVTFTPAGLGDNSRESETFTGQITATKFALKLVEEGATKVFLDTFQGTRGDELAEFTNFKQFN